MEIQTEQIGQCDLMTISGTVMATDSAALDRAFQRYLTVGRYQILLDLQDCLYIGSAGLAILISFANNCRRWKRGDLCLIAPHPYVMNLLQLAGLQGEERSFFRIVESVDKGLLLFDETFRD
jgi:anti-anti-sigma factor